MFCACCDVTCIRNIFIFNFSIFILSACLQCAPVISLVSFGANRLKIDWQCSIIHPTLTTLPLHSAMLPLRKIEQHDSQLGCERCINWSLYLDCWLYHEYHHYFIFIEIYLILFHFIQFYLNSIKEYDFSGFILFCVCYESCFLIKYV